MTPINPLDRLPPECACGAQASRLDIVTRRCQLCAVVAVEHPEFSDAEIAAEGAIRWLVPLFRGMRRRALASSSDEVTWTEDGARFEWSVKDGYERLTVTGLKGPAAAQALGRECPELVIASSVRKDDTLAFKLVERRETEVAA